MEKTILEELKEQLASIERTTSDAVAQIKALIEGATGLDGGDFDQRHVALVKAIGPAGLPSSDIGRIARDIGYQSGRDLGGFFKGDNALLAKVKIPTGESRIFPTERGMALLRRAAEQETQEAQEQTDGNDGMITA